MKVRIKDSKGYIDADWTIEDGVMIVFPKKAKFEPKDGDVVVCDDCIGDEIQIFICKENLGGAIYSYCMYGTDDNKLTFHQDTSYMIDRPATEEEKKLLFDKLAEEGWSWDADKKELVKIKWKPKAGEQIYVAGFTIYNENRFIVFPEIFRPEFEAARRIEELGWCFKTELECQAFCDKLNEAISQVKP